MKTRDLLMLPLAAALSLACSQDNYSPSAQQVCVVPDVPGVWTYFSFSANGVVGQATVGDSAAEQQWRERLDWDIAVCNGLIKTNGGKSGNGKGFVRTQGGEYKSDRDTTITKRDR